MNRAGAKLQAVAEQIARIYGSAVIASAAQSNGHGILLWIATAAEAASR
jgi:hypothetical protein